MEKPADCNDTAKKWADAIDKFKTWDWNDYKTKKLK